MVPTSARDEVPILLFSLNYSLLGTSTQTLNYYTKISKRIVCSSFNPQCNVNSVLFFKSNVQEMKIFTCCVQVKDTIPDYCLSDIKF